MTIEETKAFFARREDHYARLDAAALAADYSEDCVVESLVAGVHSGRQAVEQVLRHVFSAFPDMSTHTEELLIFGDRTVQILTIRGIDNGGLMGLPPTGRRFSLSAIFLFTLRDGQIVHERRSYDFARLLLQLAGEAGPVTEGPQLYRETLERARSEHELKIAGDIQRALMPKLEYTGTGFQVTAASVPCRTIGGDFFDYFNLPNGTFGFVLGDVSGKGPPAALLAAEVQGILTGLSCSTATPAETLNRLNHILVRRAFESRFVTMLYGELSCDGRLTYSNAGHNSPFLVGRRGVRRLERGGLILGVFTEATFEQETVQLDRDDLIVAFTDGVTEALNRDGSDFGEERLLSCVVTNREAVPATLLGCLLGAIREFSDGAAQNDDVTALVLRYSGVPEMTALTSVL